MTIVGDRPAPPVDLIHGASLFLDFDGTLVELADRPDAVVVGDRVRRILSRLEAALQGRLAIVTGRPLTEVQNLLGMTNLPVSGSHGAEMLWPNGSRKDAEPPAWLPETAARLQAFSRDRPGVLIETKPFGVALHYRQAQDAERACLHFAESLADTCEIDLVRGKMVVELRPPGVDKGAAIAAFMADDAMLGTFPLFFGDDVTDEAGFAMARELGGAGVLIGEDRPSAARYALPDVSGALAWLEAATDRIAA